MKREELEEIIKKNNCISGGTKEACIKVREVLCNKMNPGNQLHAPLSCVDIEEFIESVAVLVALAMKQPDTKFDQYCCENDCAYYNVSCPGECNGVIVVKAKDTKTCPYYEIEDK